MKKLLLSAIVVFIAPALHAQPVVKNMLKLPDTGVISGYTSTFGEDNDFNTDVPLLHVNGNGTVTDSITGLLWQQLDGGEMTIDNAILYCDTLTLGGFTDWRLPNAHEAFSIINLQYANPAMDTLFFTKTAAQYWWTSDRQANDSNKVWVTNSGGGIGNHPRTETISAGGVKRFHVRAVRDVVSPQLVTAHFTDNGDGTVTDILTGLIWQKQPYADTLTWEDALVYADTLSLAGASDWRLPNIREIRSINTETIHHPSLDTALFQVQNGQKFWSSTTLRNQTAKAWYFDDQFGITTYDFKANRHEILCVRGNTMTTGITAWKSEQQVVFPNPFENHIRIKGFSPEVSFELTTGQGRIVWSGTRIGEQDFSGLPSGIYFLRSDNPQPAVMKLIKP